MIGQALRNKYRNDQIWQFVTTGYLCEKNTGLYFIPHTKIQFQEDLGFKWQNIKLTGEYLPDLSMEFP